MYNQKYINSILRLQDNLWFKLDLKTQMESANDLIDFYCHVFSIPNEYKFALVDFKNDTTMARYVPETKTIEMRRDLFCEGKVIFSNGQSMSHSDPTGIIFFYLTHEIKHAEQDYYLNNPHLCKNKDRLQILQYNQKCTGELNSYFIINTNIEKHERAQRALYMLQPCEREAWEFAHNETNSFVTNMNELINTISKEFKDNAYSDFRYVQMLACAYLQSNSPIQDIDNILKTMNGQFIDAPLNQYICDVIRETQSPTMYSRIKEQEKINIEQSSLDIQEQDIDEAYISELFNDIDTPNIGG